MAYTPWTAYIDSSNKSFIWRSLVMSAIHCILIEIKLHHAYTLGWIIAGLDPGVSMIEGALKMMCEQQTSRLDKCQVPYSRGPGPALEHWSSTVSDALSFYPWALFGSILIQKWDRKSIGLVDQKCRWGGGGGCFTPAGIRHCIACRI